VSKFHGSYVTLNELTQRKIVSTDYSVAGA